MWFVTRKRFEVLQVKYRYALARIRELALENFGLKRLLGRQG